MAAYLGYTLRMKTLFRGSPVMVNDIHTRRRKSHGQNQASMENILVRELAENGAW